MRCRVEYDEQDNDDGTTVFRVKVVTSAGAVHAFSRYVDSDDAPRAEIMREVVAKVGSEIVRRVILGLDPSTISA